SSRRRHTICYRDWSSDVCSSDLGQSEAFSSISNNDNYYSTRGFATFTMDDKISSSFIISWKVPNTGGYYIYFLSKKKYIIDFKRSEERRVGKEFCVLFFFVDLL